MAEMLTRNGIETKLVDVVDGNCLDREITLFRPTHVIVEAYWTTPAKFTELSKLHKNVKWIVRNHSKPAFLAQEGITFEWSLQYVRQGITIACNSEEATHALKHLCKSFGLNPHFIEYLPNFYKNTYNEAIPENEKPNQLNIGCFGAIRPLKNQVNQALAAIRAADELDKHLHFHINGERVESGGAPVFKSLKAIFEAHPKHKLVVHPWLEHDDFLKLVGSMDVALQVSYSETFNIVSADAVSQNVPVVVSDEIAWLKGFLSKNPNPNSVAEISDAIIKVLNVWDWCGGSRLKFRRQRESLNKFNAISERIWLEAFSR
jgi:hypothetical protein